MHAFRVPHSLLRACESHPKALSQIVFTVLEEGAVVHFVITSSFVECRSLEVSVSWAHTKIFSHNNRAGFDNVYANANHHFWFHDDVHGTVGFCYSFSRTLIWLYSNFFFFPFARSVPIIAARVRNWQKKKSSLFFTMFYLIGSASKQLTTRNDCYGHLLLI